MAQLVMKKAKREQAKIKISISGPAGSGKTMSSLLVGFGLTKAEFPNLTDSEAWDKICVIDTENGSGSLYVGSQVGRTTIGSYNTIPLSAPFEPQVFIDAIHMAEDAGMNVIIIDSLSHAWAGTGGALDQQGAIAARSGNSYTAWRSVTPQHNKLVNAMLESKCHVIANMRAKMDYEQTTNEAGKKMVKAVGMGVIMRDGIEYEFTVSFMLDHDHNANATKDRTGVFDGRYFMISEDTGKQMYEWLASGIPEKPKEEVSSSPAPTKEEPAIDEEQIAKAVAAVDELIKSKVTAENKEEIAAKIESIIGAKNYKKCKDLAKLRELYKAFKE